MKSLLNNISGTTKTVVISLLALYLSVALGLYQFGDSSPSGIVGVVFTSLAAGLDYLLGLAVWVLIIWMYIIIAIRTKIIAPREISKPLMVVTLLSAAGLLEDSALGNIIIIFIQPILGVWGGKVLLVTILFLCVMKLFGEFIKKLLKLLPTPKRLLELLRRGFPKKLQDRSKPIQKRNLEKKHRLDSTNPTKEKKLISKPIDKTYLLPALDLLNAPKENVAIEPEFLKKRAEELQKAILSFGIITKIEKWVSGPMATTFNTELETGTKISKLISVTDDISRFMGLSDNAIRISGNIEGEKNTIGIELPNPERSFCLIREVLEHSSYDDGDATLPMALGIGINGDYIYEDLTKFPHLMLAGSTGSGKSVALNGILLSLLYKKKPSELNLVLIDPKAVEFSLYRGIPHLLGDVITEMDESVDVLHELTELMKDRYEELEKMQVRNISEYNQKILSTENSDPTKIMSHIVVCIDELADLIITHGKKVENMLGRLSQKARAAGIHLVLATQRPTSDVIKGLIKTNVPARIAFRVASHVDSNVILQSKGAESMLGQGDCLLLTPFYSSLKRIQSPLVTTEEIQRVVKAIG